MPHAALPPDNCQSLVISTIRCCVLSRPLPLVHPFLWIERASWPAVHGILPRHLGNGSRRPLLPPKPRFSFSCLASTTMHQALRASLRLAGRRRSISINQLSRTISRQPASHFSSSTSRSVRYERFRQQPGTHGTHQHRDWWDFQNWSTRERVVAAVIAMGGVYYVTQCVSLDAPPLNVYTRSRTHDPPDGVMM